MTSQPAKHPKPVIASLDPLASPMSTLHHPLDPADSFVHIDVPSPSDLDSKKREKTKNPKAAPSSSLEDGWDLVDELDESPRPSAPTPIGKSPRREATKRAETTFTKSASSGLTSSRGATSLPPTKSSQTSKQDLQRAANPTSPNKPAGEPTTRNRSKSGSKANGAEFTSNSGFKHRIYCTLYNFYHAQPSEPPALSNTPIYMMGAILVPPADSDGVSIKASPYQSPQSTPNTSSTRRDKTKLSETQQKSLRDEFLDMVRSLTFFSYRKDFPRLEGFNVTSDVGWGCMLRTGQMLLATALQRLHEPILSGSAWQLALQRDRGRMPVGQELMTPVNAQIIAQLMLDWFKDSPDIDRHPYSIHNLVSTSLALNPTPDGTVSGPSWFSPTKVARILRFLVRMHNPERLTMYVPPEGVIYVDEIVALCTEPYTSTMTPTTNAAHLDRTFLWWKRYSASGPSVSRSYTLPDYDDDNASDGEENDLNLGNLENDALYQRALVESMAQYESEGTPRTPVPTVASAPVSDINREWTFQPWKDTSHSLQTPVSKPQITGTSPLAGEGAKEQERALLKSSSPSILQQPPNAEPILQDNASYAAIRNDRGGAIQAGDMRSTSSIGSNGSIEASSTWIQLSHTTSPRGSLESIPGFAQLHDDTLDEYFKKDPVVSMQGSVNLSSIVENHEELSGEPKMRLMEPKLPAETSNRLLSAHQPSPFGWNAASAPTPSTSAPSHFGPSHGASPYSSVGSTEEFATMSSSVGLASSSAPIGGQALGNGKKRDGILEDTVFVVLPDSQVSTSASPSSVTATISVTTSREASSSTATTTTPMSNPKVTFKAPNECWRPLLLLIPSRLGVNKVNPVYIEHLKFSLSSPYSVGIIGGKPNKSLYFFAFQEDFVFYLDPHFVHNSVRPVDSKGNVHDSYKVKFPQKTKFLDLDPSLALGFFIRTRSDFESFCQAHHNFAIQCQDDPTVEPIFTLQDSAPDYLRQH